MSSTGLGGEERQQLVTEMAEHYANDPTRAMLAFRKLNSTAFLKEQRLVLLVADKSEKATRALWAIKNYRYAVEGLEKAERGEGMRDQIHFDHDEMERQVRGERDRRWEIEKQNHVAKLEEMIDEVKRNGVTSEMPEYF
jgi:hypothetical protein